MLFLSVRLVKQQMCSNWGGFFGTFGHSRNGFRNSLFYGSLRNVVRGPTSAFTGESRNIFSLGRSG